MSFAAAELTYVISTTATSKTLALPVGQSHALITNPSLLLTVTVGFAIGSATVVIPTADGAGTACYQIPPMGQLIVDIPKGTTFWAAIASGAGPTLVSLTPGFSS